MRIPATMEWMASQNELQGKTIATVEPIYYDHLEEDPAKCSMTMQAAPDDAEANGWRLTFTDGSFVDLFASRDDSTVHFASGTVN